MWLSFKGVKSIALFCVSLDFRLRFQEGCRQEADALSYWIKLTYYILGLISCDNTLDNQSVSFVSSRQRWRLMAQLPLLLKKEVLHVLELKVKLNSRHLDS